MAKNFIASDQQQDATKEMAAELDMSSGYEAVADLYVSTRSKIGQSLIRDWVKAFQSGSSVLDLGAGSGDPLISILIERGLTVYAIDGSKSLISELQRNYPEVKAACESAETSSFFGKTFDGIMSIGLVFLLPTHHQVQLLQRLSRALKPGGRLLFSAPEQVCEWVDNLTGRTSYSLGKDEYTRLLNENKMTLLSTYTDEGGNHYFEAKKNTENSLPDKSIVQNEINPSSDC